MYSIVSCRNYSNRKGGVVKQSENLDDILELLKKDKYYHSITSKEENIDYMLFFDVDGNEHAKEDKPFIEVDIHDFIAKMKSYINKTYYFNLTEDDFCYTQNDKNKYKFHVTVPSICATIKQQKELHAGFVNVKENEKYRKYKDEKTNKYKEIYDSSVYETNKLFRLPNQSKGIKDGKDYGIHIIKRGNMEDFILENTGSDFIMDNIPDDDLDDDPEESNNFMSKTKEDPEEEPFEDDQQDSDNEDYGDYENYEEPSIYELLEKFPYDKYYTGRRSWLYFMGVLKSAGLTWESCCEYSQRLPNHTTVDIPVHTCEKVFNSLKKPYNNPIQRIRNIIAKHGFEYEKVSSFNFKVKYDILDFKMEFNHRRYETYNELKHDITQKLMSVCAYIIELECFMIKSNGNLKMIKTVKNCLPKILLKGGEGKSVECNLQKFIVENTLFNYNSVDYILNDYKNSRIFNIWKGYNADIVTEVDQEVIDVTIDFLLKVFCNGDKELLRYVLTWFSNLVSTDDINKIALVIVSEQQGTGKGTFLEFMAKILGSHCFKAVTGVGPITQKHNDVIVGIRLLVMNEAASTREEFRSNFDKMKTYITDPILDIEPKGFKHYDATNLGNYIIVSNHRDSVVIENNDRRYQVLECSDVYANNTEYFSRIRKILQLRKGDEDKMEAANSFYTYLMNYNDKVDLFKIIDTPLRQEMKERSLPNTVKFIKEYQEKLDSLESNLGMEKNASMMHSEHLYKLRAMELYQKYKDWATTNTEKIATNTKFGMDIKNYVNKVLKKDGTYYIFNKKEN